jgi:spermidine synthase
MSERTATEKPAPRLFLFLTAAICGALVMVIEVLGARVVAPFYGVNLFVWTSLIAVTLVSLAVGYALGGVFADRRGGIGNLYGIILAAGVMVLLLPVIKAPVLMTFQPWGLRMGALVSSTILFGPSLVLLGCVSPFVVKLATADLNRVGRTVGAFYAVSTVGSFLGTVATGFVLIAWLGISRIFWLVGATLILLALVYFVHYRRQWAALGLVLLLVFPGTERELVELVRASGTKVNEVHHKDGFYGTVQVVDYTGGAMHTREMMIDGYIQGGVDMKNGLSIYAFAPVVQHLSRALVPRGKRALVVGVGAGLMPLWFEKEGITVDVVDIDPHVVRTAQEWFELAVSGEIFIEDARYYLRRTSERYDYVILDVFSGESTPGHVISLEAFQLAHQRIDPGGVLTINVIGCLGEGQVVIPSVARTLEEVFDQVLVHPIEHPDFSDGCSNVILFAYDGPERVPDLTVIRDRRIHPMAVKAETAITRSYRLPPNAEAFVITDDFNPTDLLDLPFRERLRRNILADLNWELLL